MIEAADRVILNALLDKYETSKRFSGENKVDRKIQVQVTALFPEYLDHANYDDFNAVNEAIESLTRINLVVPKISRAKVCSQIQLNLDTLADAYLYLGRTPKKDIHSALLDLLMHT